MTEPKPQQSKPSGRKRPLNIIWLIVDSVRNYRCDAERFDDRGRLDVMDDLASEWIDFRTSVTSAPSTLMSMGAMFTGRPSYHVGTAFDGLAMSDCGLPTIGSILSKEGYKSYCVTRYTFGRECWRPIFEDIPRRYWPKGATHRKQWTNAQANEAIFNLVPTIENTPFFLFVHYTCRGDPLISDHVRRGLEFFQQRGLMDNSVILLTSDHGYPDPLRAAQVANRRRELGMSEGEISHDLVLTDDNVLIPLLVKYPGSRAQTIEQQICTLDYMPTALELAGVDCEHTGMGMSVVPLLNGHDMPEIESRKTRIDGRFMAQTGRITAIRSKTRKYVVYPDETGDSGGAKEEFYDLEKDPLEVEDVLKRGAEGYEAEIAEFRDEYTRDQEQAHTFIVNFLAEKYRTQQKKYLADKPCEPKQILYIGINRALFDGLVVRMLEQVFPQAEVSSTSADGVNEHLDKQFDLVHAGIESKLGNKHLLMQVSKLHARKVFLIDLCGNIRPMTKHGWLGLLRVLWRKRYWYSREPMYLFSEVWEKLRGKS